MPLTDIGISNSEGIALICYFYFVKLCFEEHPLEVEVRQGKTFVKDPIRKKWVSLNGEEYVRQQLIQYLVYKKNIGPGRIGVEKGIAYNEMKKRFDIVVFDKMGKPLVLCECKAPDVELNRSTLNQISRYNSTMQAPYLLVTNGLRWIFFEKNALGVFEPNPTGWSEHIV
jgi:hypothetical protein